jgi:hypothetical protein
METIGITQKPISDDKAVKFLSVSFGSGYGSGYGDGDGSGDGYGDGSGSGSGYGDGYGYGDGDGSGSVYGDGSGYGSGDGSDLKSYSNHKVYIIDNVPTILLRIKNNVANGYIINQDLTITKTFIVKVGNYFAHGDSIKSALNDAQAKFNDNLPDEAKIEMFLSEFNLVDKYDCKVFFDWHKTLTGSCEQGRLSFMKNKGIEFGEKFTKSIFQHELYAYRFGKNIQLLNEDGSINDRDKSYCPYYQNILLKRTPYPYFNDTFHNSSKLSTNVSSTCPAIEYQRATINFASGYFYSSNTYLSASKTICSSLKSVLKLPFAIKLQGSSCTTASGVIIIISSLN